MKKVYTAFAVTIGICIFFGIMLSFSHNAMPKISPGFEHMFNTGNVWYNIVNFIFIAVGIGSVTLLPLGIIIFRIACAAREKRKIAKLDRERDKRIKEEIRRIKEAEKEAKNNT